MIEVISPPSLNGTLTASNEGSKTTGLINGWRLARLGQTLIWFVFPLTLSLAITRQSLWIDEGSTVWFASHRSITSFFSALIGSPTEPGDPQMIFYLSYMWAWIKFFGTSELALRAANIPFAILFIGTMSWASRRWLHRPSPWVLFCLSPFFWFYLNEARPYAALLALSSVAIVALLAYLMYPADYKTSAPWCCAIALLLAWGTHILAAFLFPSLVVLATATAMGEPDVRRNFFKDWYRPALLCAPASVGLGTFYIRVSAYGVNKTYGKPGLSNLAYALYEFSGFGGLGPPRNDLRNAPGLSVFAPYWPLLLMGVVALLGLGLFLFSPRPPKIAWPLAASLMAGVAAALTISMIQDFQILGRHMAALFPLFLITIMLWLKQSFRSRLSRYASIAALIMLAVTWGMSDARLIFVQKYHKDSYRDASFIVLARAHVDQGKILWAADPTTAYYYGIQVTNLQPSAELGKRDKLNWRISNQAVDARNWSLDQATAYLDASTTPTILVLSKPDVFDRNGGWRALIHQRESAEVAQLTAFSIYEWKPKRADATVAARYR